jgi:penicillin-binding protein 2
MVIPRELKNIDTLRICQLLKITSYIKTIAKVGYTAHVYHPFFLPQLNKSEFAAFQKK